MTWNALAAFMRAEGGPWLASLTGVSREEIAAVETEFDVQLPDSYIQFLLMMGEESGGLHLFGPSERQRFGDVVAQIRDDAGSVQQYFTIAYADDEEVVAPSDYFLDLPRGNRVDAPVVMFEGGGEVHPDDVRDHGFTFLEQAYRRVAAFLADGRFAERALVAVPMAIEPGPAAVAALVAVLQEMRFERSLEPLSRVVCLRRNGMWAIVDLRGGGRAPVVNLWSAERPALEAVIDQLLVRFPDAAVKDRGAPPGR